VKVPPACAPAPDVRVSLLFRRASGIVLAAIAIGLSPASALAQSSTELDLGDEVHYPWTFTGAPGGFGSSSVENQTSRVLTVPVSIWLRRLTDGRKLGLRLRLTGVLGFQDFQGIEDFEIKSIRLGGLFPGIEFLIPLNDRSLLRPFIDLGVGLTNSDAADILVSNTGLRSEFIFPWRRWELGLEPRVQGSTTRASVDLVDGNFVLLAMKMDARYPLGFTIGGSTPDVGAYFEPGWFANPLEFRTEAGDRDSIDQQHEVGLTVGFRDLAPRIWFFRVPRLSVGYQFGDGLSGLRIRIGGDRVFRLPLPSS
jgi:hypothetical protein